jgi:hypothetical protein
MSDARPAAIPAGEGEVEEDDRQSADAEGAIGRACGSANGDGRGRVGHARESEAPPEQRGGDHDEGGKRQLHWRGGQGREQGDAQWRANCGTGQQEPDRAPVDVANQAGEEMEACGDLEQEDGWNDLGRRVDGGQGGNGQQRESEPSIAPDDGGQEDKHGGEEGRNPFERRQASLHRRLSGGDRLIKAA